MLNQCQSLTPWMRLTLRFVLVLGTTSGVVAAVLSWQLALLIGYPLPFTMLVGTPAVVILVVVALFWSQREQLRNTQDARHDIIRYVHVLNCRFFMTIVYPLFNHVFGQATSTQQTALVLIHPVIKTTCKLWIHHALKDNQDTKPEVIIFNVEVFHALFVAHCMQTTASIRTVLVLVAFDLAHEWLSLKGVLHVLKDLQGLHASHYTQRDLCNVLEVAIEMLRHNPELYESAVPYIGPRHSLRVARQVAPVTLDAKVAKIRTVGPDQQDLAASLGRLDGRQRRHFFRKVLELLYLTEFIVFIEYTEVIVPVIYSKCSIDSHERGLLSVVFASVYSLILSCMWNHEHYGFLKTWSTVSILSNLGNVALYMLAEALSLILLAVVL